MSRHADVIVIGLGAAGSAAAHHLARRGARVLGLDRHHPPHDHGSSHGESRITRQAIGEGDAFVPLALRAHELWRELEAESGETLFLATGAVIIGDQADDADRPGKPGFIGQTLGAAERFGIPHEVLAPDEAARRFPQLRFGGHETVYFEPGAGLLLAERCVVAQLAQARRYGADIRLGEAVLDIRDSPGGVSVATDREAYSADQVVVAAGAWAGGLLRGAYAGRLSTWRQILHWYEPEDVRAFAPEAFPVFIWMHGPVTADWFYGFPILPGVPGVKIAEERFDAPLSGPEAQTQVIPEGDSDGVFDRHIAGRLPGLGRNTLKSAACLYTMAPESRFLIGRDPARERVIVASACSGHGFKHSAAVGEMVARLALEPTAPEALAPFAI